MESNTKPRNVYFLQYPRSKSFLCWYTVYLRVTYSKSLRHYSFLSLLGAFVREKSQLIEMGIIELLYYMHDQLWVMEELRDVVGLAKKCWQHQSASASMIVVQ